MPCNSDYMNQTPAERHNERAAELMIFLDDIGVAALSGQTRSKYETQATYYSVDDGQVKNLCSLVRDLKDKGALEQIVKDNVMNPLARDLLDWVQEHEAQDVRRAEAEASNKRSEDENVITRALKELSPESLAKLKEIFVGLK